MAIQNLAAFAQYRRTSFASLTTANTNLLTPTNTALVAVAGPDGALITRLSAMPTTTQLDTQLQVFLSKDGGTTFDLLTTAKMSAQTPTTTTQLTPTAVTQVDGTPLSDVNPIPLAGVTDYGSTIIDGGTSQGSVNAQTLPFASSVTALTAGLVVDFEAGLTNTLTTTLTVGTATAASVVWDKSGAALSAGDLTTGFRYRVWCDGSFWRLMITDRLYAAMSVTVNNVRVTAQQADF